jgi:predicted RNA-binding Zn ribbon-like protein
MRLVHPDGQAFNFDAGALCLELACTTGGEGFRARFEVLHTPADIARWAARSRLDLPGHGLDPADVVATADHLTRLRRLREAIWSAANTAADGGPPDPVDLAVINSTAADPPPKPMLDPRSLQVTWRRPVTARQLVAAIARDGVTTLSRLTVHRIRRCAGMRCYLVYLDTSRPGRRRWCSMQRCGNRNKAREHRHRQQEC